MSQVNRLDAGRMNSEHIDRSSTLSFTFDGRELAAHAGDTVASALLANGVDVVGHSFKYARPRGIMAAGCEEPNAILQMGATPETQTPNVRATQQPVYEGLVCESVGRGRNFIERQQKSLTGLIGKWGGRFMPVGFYYKTFMAPQSAWLTYEKFIRAAAGLGRAPTVPDADTYDHMNRYCDVLVVGAGPAGLAAALAAGQAGARVIVCDEQEQMGGCLLDSRERPDDQPAGEWLASTLAELEAMEDVLLLPRTTANGYHDHNFVTLHERRTDHLGDRAPAGMTRQRMHRVRAQRVILATGAHERPLVFANNDLPGHLLAGAISCYIRRYGVVPGQQLVLATTNSHAYRAALDWLDAGREVAAIVDARAEPDGTLVNEARSRGIRIITGASVIECRGDDRVSEALVADIDIDGFRVTGETEAIACDTLASSGGYSPVVHLSAHTGSKPVWNDRILGFVPGETKQQLHYAGGVHGIYPLADALADGVLAGSDAAVAAGYERVSPNLPSLATVEESPQAALYHVPHTHATMRAPKQFVDPQNDVTAAGIELAIREGFESIEHVKRYTAMGFGTDQGKIGNINGMAIAARVLGQTIPETGTTVFRPNYTPVSFGAIAGRYCGAMFDPERYTAMHRWHVEHGALFENVGQWKRPWYYPGWGGARGANGEETLQEAVNRECLAVRNGVGILDASTLGKIDIQGPDAREFIGRVYTNGWEKLPVGKGRYGLMCGEDGMVMDDGVTTCLGEHHFLMTTTTGNAAQVLDWLELWHQTEWPELEVFFTSVTDHWATMTLTGPKSRELLEQLTDIDLSRDAFAFMAFREGTVAGIPARVYRISFTGELSFEINVQANYAMHVWEALFDHGEAFELTPYGTETMHVLRAEKGFIIVGQDTDATMTPEDLGMTWAIGYRKPFDWVGKRGMARVDLQRDDRKQLVGLKPLDGSEVVLPEGAQIVFDPEQQIPMTMVGHVTSSYYSATLGHGFALAVVRGGHRRKGEHVYLPQPDGSTLEAEIVSSMFYDPRGERQHV
ncbi:sarcosine oxidase subunit alpha family protein [Kushneria phosphatilytica]|uniref:Sarcosine oxidase subunit alpha family protein n=1 Tax=Kushneria phosphatilytica TaxID=657387 RepID=A0A5C0ZVJ9_9GAMM|nr:sarcosine oxidase subunit alpha family protein [Kushneria phosphatilytica]QEL10620.1 sarcosine oxidase subunit alpha family protein [Kushneria phosphatilytica]